MDEFFHVFKEYGYLGGHDVSLGYALRGWLNSGNNRYQSSKNYKRLICKV